MRPTVTVRFEFAGRTYRVIGQPGTCPGRGCMHEDCEGAEVEDLLDDPSGLPCCDDLMDEDGYPTKLYDACVEVLDSTKETTHKRGRTT